MSDRRQEGLPVRAVTRLTGLDEHLLRAWERRYRIVVPTRTEGGSRRYSDADVERLRQVKRAVDAGNSIGAVAVMSAADLAALAKPVDDVAKVIQPLLASIEENDGSKLERDLSKLAALLGPLRWAVEVIVPLGTEIGRRWRSGTLTIGQEHLSSAITSRVIDATQSHLEVDQKVGVRSTLPRLVLATPPGEFHVIGIQLAALIGCARGFPTTMLGMQMPHDALSRSLVGASEAMVVLGITKLLRSTASSYLNKLCESVGGNTPIVVGGAAVRGLEVPGGVTVIPSLAGFDSKLEALSRRGARRQPSRSKRR